MTSDLVYSVRFDLFLCFVTEMTKVLAIFLPLLFVGSYAQFNPTCKSSVIMKTRLYNFDPLKPHFFIVKVGFTGVYIIFVVAAQKHRLWVFVRTTSTRRF